MSRLCKLVWLCLLALALPVQGVAAATMAHCGPSHERMHGPAQEQRGAHAGHAGHGHDGHATTPDAASDPLSDLAQYQCSACGACCAATALPAAAPRLPATLPAGRPTAGPGAAPVAYLTDGPERPPRTVLA